MITERDDRIIAHALKYGLTVRQCANMFFTDKYALMSAQKRLKILSERGLMKRYKVWETNEYVYGKECSRHQIYRMDFYSELSKLAEIIEFETEYREFRSYGAQPDAYFRFIFQNKERVLFLEVDLNNKTNPEKYEKLHTFHGDEVRNKLGAFPQIIIMSNHKFKYNGQLKISHVNMQLNDIIPALTV